MLSPKVDWSAACGAIAAKTIVLISTPAVSMIGLIRLAIQLMVAPGASRTRRTLLRPTRTGRHWHHRPRCRDPPRVSGLHQHVGAVPPPALAAWNVADFERAINYRRGGA